MPRTLLRAAAAVLALPTVLLAGSGTAGAAASHSPITGSGSSLSSNAVAQWVADVEPNGLKVVFTAPGSAVGRKDFANKTTDFAVTDIGYQGFDKLSGAEDTSQGREYVYLPIVAGGTTFPYQLRVGGKKVTNLRLGGDTLAKIFTNQITNWNDPAITRDNNGKGFPSKQIIPIVHSEGSGSSAQFTKYLDTQYPDTWRPFLGSSGATEYFPRKGQAVAQNGSDGVMNYIASDAADGAIGYDEYSYALAKGFPVAQLRNAAGYYSVPTQYNVAVALQRAQINQDKSSPNYLLQDLSKVYSDGDPRTYPMSSYSYMIIPTAANDPRMTTAKRQTLSDYLYYSICDGQKEIGPIGYSPLPINLAKSSFEQIGKLKQADPGVDLAQRDITTCGNPTFDKNNTNANYLAKIAPQPRACDKQGAGPCTDGVAASASGNPVGGRAATNTGGAGTATGRTSTGAATGTTTTRTGTGGTTAATGSGTAGTPLSGGTTATSGLPATAAVDPVTGEALGTAATGESSVVSGVPTELASSRQAVSTSVLGPLAALLLLGAVVAPPLVARRLTAKGQA